MLKDHKCTIKGFGALKHNKFIKTPVGERVRLTPVTLAYERSPRVRPRQKQ